MTAGLALQPKTAAPLSSDLMAALAHMEAQFPVLDWNCSGLALWPLLRIRWMYTEWARHYTDARPGSALGPGQRLQQLLLGPWRAWRADREDQAASDAGPARRDVVFLSDGASFARLGGKWVERFCDPILARARQRDLACALWTPTHTHLRPRATASRFVQPGIDRANIAGALAARLPGRPALALAEQPRVAAWLRAQGFDASPLEPGRVLQDTSRLLAIAGVHERRLRRAAPKLAFVVGFYGIEGMAFVLACRRCGVPVVDIQHGVQGDMHPAYAAWPSPPPGGQHALLPDRFWVWSDWEAGVIEQWARGTGHAAVVGGNPWMDIWQPGSQWGGAAAALEGASGLRQRAGGRPAVLVTLQYGLVDAEQLEPLAALLQSCAERFAFWVRLHPAMLERREEVRRLLARGGPCEIDLPTDLPLPALLQHADVHLTHSSTTVIEAAQFGVRSALTTSYGAELFGPLMDAGMACLETGDPPQLAATLQRLAGAGRRSLDAAPPVAAALESLLAPSRRATPSRTA